MEKWIIQMFVLVAINFFTSCGINAATGEPEREKKTNQRGRKESDAVKRHKNTKTNKNAS